MTRLYPVPLLGALLLAALPLSAQPAPDGVQRDMDRLRAENSVLRRELKAIKAIVDGVQAKLAASSNKVLAGPAALKVGVVDIERLFKSHPRRAVYEKELDQLNRKNSLTSENLSAALKARGEEITLELYADIESAVTRYGADKSFDLILKRDSSTQSSGGGPADTILRRQVNAVLYRTEALDVTSDVIASLNSPEAEWFEPGPLARVVYVLEQAGVSFAGRRVGQDLVIDCRLTKGSLTEVARLRDSLRAESIARHYRGLARSGQVQIKAEPWPHLSLQLRLKSWTGGGAERLLSLDRVIEEDSSGTLGRVVERWRASGLQVQGRSGRELHVTIRGPRPKIAAFQSSQLTRSDDLEVKRVTTHRDGESRGRVELILRVKKQSTPLGIEHHPVQGVKAVAQPGRNVITWSRSPRNRYVHLSEVVVEVAEGKSETWRPLATLPPVAISCIHQVEDGKVRRYRVVTLATEDAESPRVRRGALQLAPAERRKVSAVADPVRSVPTVVLLPRFNKWNPAGEAWIRVYRYHRATETALPPWEFSVKVGQPIGALIEIDGKILDYRTGATLLMVGESQGVKTAVVAWSDGRHEKIRGDDPDPAAHFPKYKDPAAKSPKK